MRIYYLPRRVTVGRKRKLNIFRTWSILFVFAPSSSHGRFPCVRNPRSIVQASSTIITIVRLSPDLTCFHSLIWRGPHSRLNQYTAKDIINPLTHLHVLPHRVARQQTRDNAHLRKLRSATGKRCQLLQPPRPQKSTPTRVSSQTQKPAQCPTEPTTGQRYAVLQRLPPSPAPRPASASPLPTTSLPLRGAI